MNHLRTKVLTTTSLILFILLLTSVLLNAEEQVSSKTLIVYYSLTGKTKACCEALQKALGADIQEIKDLRDRSGKWGFFKTAIGSLLGRHTKIEPETIDLSPYQNIVIGSPIWTGKLSMAARTFIDKNRFDEKRVVIFTTTNAFEKEKYKEKSKNLVREKGGNVVGYYQILAMEQLGEKIERSQEQMIKDTVDFVPEIQNAFSLAPLKSK